MNEFTIGQKIFWRDPEDETSGAYKVLEKISDYVYLIGNGTSEAEVEVGEMYKLSQKVLFRKWAISGTVIALFPEQELDERPCIVASYQSEDMERDADYDHVMEATVPATKREYQELLAELKEDGYDALEIIPEPPINLCRLLGSMDRIAQKLIPSIYITDFTKHDRKAIVESKAQRAFVWQVRDSGTWLYFMDEDDWKKRLLEKMEIYKTFCSKENLYYLFDGEDFYPVFEQIILEMIKA
jgi:hypothetical protein